MARVRINRATVHVTALRFAVPLVRKVLREVEQGARARLLHGPYTTGRLAQSLHTVGPTTDGFRVNGTVSSNLVYAAAVNSGARPHIIRGRGNYRLRFFWRRVGYVVTPWSVRHPGQPGKHYLTASLLEVAARHRFRVVIDDF